MKTPHGKILTPGDLWFRVGFGAVLMLVGILLQAGVVSVVIFLLGAAWIIWAAIRGTLQVRKAQRIEAERNARR